MHMESELQRLATTDVLTQSSNRRYFFLDMPMCAAWRGRREDTVYTLPLDADDQEDQRLYRPPGRRPGPQRIAFWSGSAALRQGDLFGADRRRGVRRCCCPAATSRPRGQIGECLQREGKRPAPAEGEW